MENPSRMDFGVAPILGNLHICSYQSVMKILHPWAPHLASSMGDIFQRFPNHYFSRCFHGAHSCHSWHTSIFHFQVGGVSTHHLHKKLPVWSMCSLYHVVSWAVFQLCASHLVRQGPEHPCSLLLQRKFPPQWRSRGKIGYLVLAMQRQKIRHPRCAAAICSCYRVSEYSSIVRNVHSAPRKGLDRLFLPSLNSLWESNNISANMLLQFTWSHQFLSLW
jgi:hypothetical protein